MLNDSLYLDYLAEVYQQLEKSVLEHERNTFGILHSRYANANDRGCIFSVQNNAAVLPKAIRRYAT